MKMLNSGTIKKMGDQGSQEVKPGCDTEVGEGDLCHSIAKEKERGGLKQKFRRTECRLRVKEGV